MKIHKRIQACNTVEDLKALQATFTVSIKEVRQRVRKLEKRKALLEEEIAYEKAVMEAVRQPEDLKRRFYERLGELRKDLLETVDG